MHPAAGSAIARRGAADVCPAYRIISRVYGALYRGNRRVCHIARHTLYSTGKTFS
jgi:hypothetical protein